MNRGSGVGLSSFSLFERDILLAGEEEYGGVQGQGLGDGSETSGSGVGSRSHGPRAITFKNFILV